MIYEYIAVIRIREAMAYGALILNIAHIAIRNPKSDRYHLDLKDGRYEGEDPKWFRNDIRQRDP